MGAKKENNDDEMDEKVKKYLRGEAANLEVINVCVYLLDFTLFFMNFFFVNFLFIYFLQGLKDKKLKGQLAVREYLYGKSAKTAAKIEKVSLSFLFEQWVLFLIS